MSQDHIQALAQHAAEALLDSGDWAEYVDDGDTDDLIRIAWDEQFKRELRKHVDDAESHWPAFHAACNAAVERILGG